MLDKHMRVVARPDTPVINLGQLIALLKSKDAALWERAKWMFDGQFRFLDGAPNKSNKIAFCSFPRSGNTFLRRYMELLTGISTGADNSLNFGFTLQMQGLKGENVYDDTVWIVKSHAPIILPENATFHANKCIVVVRNPLDSILSTLNLVALNSHSLKSPINYEELYPNYFDWWVKDCATNINNWMLTMMNDAKFMRVPTLFIRFEDLVREPRPELENMMRFILGVKDLSGTNA